MSTSQFISAGDASYKDLTPVSYEKGNSVATIVLKAKTEDKRKSRKKQERLDKLYRNARFVLVPSLAEGCGLTALEAMSRGTPVICSTGGSLPEIVGDAALLHAPTNAAQLANLMTQLWRDDALQQDYAQRAKQRASQFSWAKSAHETWVLYRASNSC